MQAGEPPAIIEPAVAPLILAEACYIEITERRVFVHILTRHPSPDGGVEFHRQAIIAWHPDDYRDARNTWQAVDRHPLVQVKMPPANHH